MKKLLLSTALAALLIGGGVAVAQSAGTAGLLPRPMAMADTNKDGKVTQGELTAGLDRKFAELDVNRDGKLTREDREAARAQRREAHFATLDKDGNGQISKAEFAAPAEARDGAGPKGEGRNGPGREGWGKGGRSGHHGGGMGMMGRGMMGRGGDADKDGIVTKAEFQARAVAMFDRADTNKDGAVTTDEMRAAWKGKGEGREAGHGHHGGGAMPAPPPAQK